VDDDENCATSLSDLVDEHPPSMVAVTSPSISFETFEFVLEPACFKGGVASVKIIKASPAAARQSYF
jgi:hypothetical protein